MWAHPRVCGENLTVVDFAHAALGSSPRVRGKLPLCSIVATMTGLIPACAGKTLRFWFACAMMRAHPRVCGENCNSSRQDARAEGSSPRVRGKRSRRPHDAPSAGLIPACAGKTIGRRRANPPERAHPRVCGENTERSGVLRLRSVRSWKTLSFPSSLKVTHCRTFVQLSLSRIKL